MPTSEEWIAAYATQARADFKAFRGLIARNEISECHRLLLLQMACEKLCKAFLIQTGTSPESLQSSHGYIARPLPIVIKNELFYWPQLQNQNFGLITSARHLANEIELLNPSMTRDGQRLDNCEYPWIRSDGTIQSPLTWTFYPTQLLTTSHGRRLLKLIELSIERLHIPNRN